MTSVVIGKHGQQNVRLDLDVLLRTRLLLTASSGAGKSWLIRRLAEQLFGKVQTIIIDPEGEFASLREKFDFVLVGKGGETPADVRSAELIAHKLLELRASAVCDLYEMKPSERHRWVRLFLEALIDAPKKLWHSLVVIVDEAHVFCPEKGAGESEAAEFMIALATRGRKRGFAAVFATQRLSKLRKDAAAELHNSLVGKTTLAADRDRAADEIGVERQKVIRDEFSTMIRVLRPGQFIGTGPAIADDRILIAVGDVETTHPEAGNYKQAATPPPPTDRIKALLPKLADLPKEAEEKARTVAEFTREIRSLKAQLRTAERVQPQPVVDTAPFKDMQRKLLEADKLLRGRWRTINIIKINAEKLMCQLATLVDLEQPKLPDLSESHQQAVRPAVPPLDKGPQAKVSAPAFPVVPVRAKAENNGHLPKGERTVLIAIAQHHPEGVTRDQLAALTGYKRSTRNRYVQQLTERRFTVPMGQKICATEEGIAELGHDYQPLPTGRELLRHWLEKLPEGERRILDLLSCHHPQAVSRDEIGEATNYKRSTRNRYVQQLVARELAENVGSDQVKAKDLLFLE